jgi:beta-lactamase superfamily II metal-dependent hydrolase
MKTKIVTLTVTASLLLSPFAAHAHPGRTDSNGGHHCWTNCEKWGYEYGEYHYHNGKSPNHTPSSPSKPKSNPSRTVSSVEKQRKAAYDAAVSQGKILQQKLTAYQTAMNSGDLVKINNLYDGLSQQIKTTEAQIGKVYGSSNRNALMDKYVRPAKIAIERTIYEVSQWRLLNKINGFLASGNIAKAESEMAKLERLKKRAEEIKKAGGYAPLHSNVNFTLRMKEAEIQGQISAKKLVQYEQAIKSGDLDAINDQYDQITKQLKLVEVKIGQVPGAKNRENLSKKYILPLKKAKERTIYEVSQYRLMIKVEDLIFEGEIEKAEAEMAKLERLKKRAEEIKKAGGYEPLPASIYSELEDFEDYLLELLNSGNIEEGLFVHFINVGQGDSMYVETPNGKNMLIDGGKESAGDDVVAYLKDLGVETIDLVVATHPDSDHIGGLIQVLNEFDVKKVLDSGKEHTTETYLNYLAAIDQKQIPLEIAKEGSYIELDPEVKIQVLNALHESDENNDSSIVLKLSMGDIDYLLTGDADVEIEKEMMAEYNVEAEILKAGHHGSDTSTSQEFINAVKPETAIFSYGENEYGHPSQDVIQRLMNHGADIFSTYEDGSILVVTDGESYEVWTENE